MPRFVILEHDHPELHWDLMLEVGEILQTWRLAQPPGDLACEIAATALPDHRQMYLDYEGPVSGNRGTVQRWDAGTYVELSDTPALARVIFLHGTRIHIQVRLEQVNGTQWIFRVM